MKRKRVCGQGVSRRQFMKTGLAAGAALALSSDWGLNAWSAEPKRGGIMRISFPRAIKTLNPIKHINDAEYFQGELMYSNLCRLNTKMDAVPDLAESWEASKDATKWAFKLRKGVEFHSGGEVTAEDVVATTQAVLDPKIASPGIKNIGPIESVKALDKYTVEFVCKYPYAYLPQGMAYTDIKICPKKVVEGNFDDLAVKDHGCGPFILKEYVPGTHLIVERNPRYFMPGKPYLEGVAQYHFPDPTAEVNALLTGQLDVVREVPPHQFNRLKEQGKVTTRREISGQFINGVLGCDSAPFNDPRVRQALACCFDRDMALEMTLEGFGLGGPGHAHRPGLPALQGPAAQEKGPDQGGRPLARSRDQEGLFIDSGGGKLPARSREVRRDPQGDGQGSRTQHRRSGHGVFQLFEAGLGQRQFLCRPLQHAAYRGRHFQPPLYFRRALERTPLEQQGVR